MLRKEAKGQEAWTASEDPSEKLEVAFGEDAQVEAAVGKAGSRWNGMEGALGFGILV